MPLTFSSKGSGDFKGCPAGTYIAVCNAVADLGLQPGSGMYPDPKQQVFVRWEIPAERVKYEKDGKKLEGPQVISATYTASMHKKARLRAALESWRGKAFTDDEASYFDVGSILGKSCMIGVVETEKNGKVYSNVGQILPLPKGTPPLTAENPLIYFDQQNTEQFAQFPEWIRTKIQNPAKIQASHATGTYAQPDQAQHYDFGDQQTPAGVAMDNTYITDEDIPF